MARCDEKRLSSRARVGEGGNTNLLARSRDVEGRARRSRHMLRLDESCGHTTRSEFDLWLLLWRSFVRATLGGARSMELRGIRRLHGRNRDFQRRRALLVRSSRPSCRRAKRARQLRARNWSCQSRWVACDVCDAAPHQLDRLVGSRLLE